MLPILAASVAMTRNNAILRAAQASPETEGRPRRFKRQDKQQPVDVVELLTLSLTLTNPMNDLSFSFTSLSLYYWSLIILFEFDLLLVFT